MRHWLFILPALLLAVCDEPAQAQHSYSVNFCNYASKGKVWVAQRFYDVEAQTDVVQGWWGVDEGDCTTFAHSLGRFGSSTWAYYAYAGPTHWSGTAEKRCIDKRTTFVNPNLGRPCTAQEELVGFKQLHVQSGFAPYSASVGD